MGRAQGRGGHRLGLGLLLAFGPEARPHALRRLLHSIVVEYPGLHLREFARMANLPASHAQYHLRVLEKTGFVACVREGRKLRYHPTQATPVGDLPALGPKERRLLDLLRRPAVLQILVVLLLDGPLTISELAGRCRVSSPTIHHHLARVAPSGLVGRQPESGSLRWEVPDPALLRRLLADYEPPPAYVAGFLETWQRLAP